MYSLQISHLKSLAYHLSHQQQYGAGAVMATLHQIGMWRKESSQIAKPAKPAKQACMAKIFFTAIKTMSNIYLGGYT